jgi:hypothetical protein
MAPDSVKKRKNPQLAQFENCSWKTSVLIVV